MTIVHEIPYKPMQKQAQFHKSVCRFRAYVGGIGSGKTVAGCNEAIRLAFKYPKSYGMITAPTYTMLRDATQLTFFEFLPRQLILTFNKSENKLVLKNGSVIFFRSTEDPEKLRGPNLDWFFMDEISESKHMAWKILIGRIRRGKLDVGFGVGTPKGFNWVYKEFIEKDREEYSIVRSSSKENIHLTKDFIESLVDSYSGAFAKQEIEGEFVGFEGLVYSNFRRNNILDIRWDKLGIKHWIAGIDFGFTNPTVALLIGVDDDDRYFIVEELYERRLHIEKFIEIIKKWRDKYGMYRLPRFYADPSEPRIISDLRRNNIDAVKADNQIMKGINVVSSMIEPNSDNLIRLFILKDCKETIREFQSYRYHEEKEGKTLSDVPLKVDDHAMDAARYAIYSHKKKTTGYKPQFR